MQEIPGIQPVTPGGTGGTTTQATDAFGLGFEDLLSIVLTQLTYQDPLEPLDNYEFVSQLAQFSQIQQTETSNERLLALVQLNATEYAASLLGTRVDIGSGAGLLSGQVRSISLENGEPRLTIETDEGQTLSNLGLDTLTRIAEGS